MPFSNDCGCITMISEEFWKGLLGTIEYLTVGELAIEVTMFARENDRSAGCMYGVGYKCPFEKHATLCNPVDIRGLVSVGSVG